MKLIELLEAIDFDNVESGIKVQICHPRRSLEDYDTSWDDYDTFNAGSEFLKPFYDLRVESLSAINTDVIRVDLDFNEKEGEVDEQTD